MTQTAKKNTDTPHYHGHRDRARQKFLATNGEGMAEYELLEILLFACKPRADVKPLAKQLIAEFGSLAAVLSASAEALTQQPGIGETAASTLKIVQACALRMMQAEIAEKPIIQSWKALLDYCRASMALNKTEQFRIFFLDKKLKLIADERQQQGTVDHTPVYPREVAKRALELAASSLILVHNHPSGDPTPSKADISMTTQIIQAVTPLGMTVHDHVIIAGAEHYSFASNGLL